jgi:Glycosyl transferases group 1
MSHLTANSSEPIVSESASSGPSSVPSRCDGVIWFGNVDWWYHNRGHASVRMATRVARRVTTVWINSIGMRMPVPGRTEIAWRRYQRKFKSLFKGLRRDPDTGMWIYSPFFIPSYTPRMIEFNGMLLAAQVRLIRRRFGMRRPSTCLSMPTMTPAAERLPWTKVVFDRCDDFTTLPESDARIIGALEQRLLKLCNHAAYVSQDLFEKERSQVADAQLIGHGVDFDAFTTARPLEGARQSMPAAIRNLTRPIVGFYGGMDDYRMDKELMIKIARRIAPATLLLIGPEQLDLSRVKAETNVTHIPQLRPEELPAYVAHFDVGIIPFLRNEFNRLCNPTKLKEYLALSFPIVAADLPAFEPYAGLIATAQTHDEFLDKLVQAMADDDIELARRRRATVADADWNKVADRMAEMLSCPDAGDRVS